LQNTVSKTKALPNIVCNRSNTIMCHSRLQSRELGNNYLNVTTLLLQKLGIEAKDDTLSTKP
jgi:hypothetical protein